jgi:hypothetical protein
MSPEIVHEGLSEPTTHIAKNCDPPPKATWRGR